MGMAGLQLFFMFSSFLVPWKGTLSNFCHACGFYIYIYIYLYTHTHIYIYINTSICREGKFGHDLLEHNTDMRIVTSNGDENSYRLLALYRVLTGIILRIRVAMELL